MPDTIQISKGSSVLHLGRPAIIDRYVDLERAMIKLEDGSFATVKVSELGRKASAPEVQKRNEIPLEAFSDKSISLAKERLKIIQPIIDDPDNKSSRIDEAVKRTGLSRSTIYRWLSKYEISPRLTSLTSNASRKRCKQLDKRVERIIKDVIDEMFLTPKRVSQKRVIEEVKERCRSAKLKGPHPNTIRSRIHDLSEKIKVRGQRSAKMARERHAAIRGKFPEGAYPLECVQMDTQELDVNIVSTKDRQYIGRPYVTLAIDTFSRMVVGYHLSLDSASAYTACACVHHMMLPKDKTLEQFGVEAPWPVWGKPGNIHVDNGKDFRSKSLQRACEKHNMTVEFRPPSFPNWGGHVESFFDTLKHWVHDLDGTTKSSPRDRADYDAIKGSNMTVDELEKWLVTFIVYVYHNRIHSMIEMPPIERWRDGIEGRNGCSGIGLIPMPVDTRDLRLDFLPSAERTVGRYGIKWSRIHYYSDVLDRWINEKKGGKSVKHIVRWDPHDISKLYFFDPELEKYFEIPYSDIAHPSIDIWELRRAQEFLAKQGLKKSDQDEALIFDGIRRMRAIESESKALTKRVSRKKKRKDESKRRHVPASSETRQDHNLTGTLNAENIVSIPTSSDWGFSSAVPHKPALTDEDYGEWS